MRATNISKVNLLPSFIYFFIGFFGFPLILLCGYGELDKLHAQSSSKKLNPK